MTDDPYRVDLNADKFRPLCFGGGSNRKTFESCMRNEVSHLLKLNEKAIRNVCTFKHRIAGKYNKPGL